mmetsp:Transcript_6976/g.16094  ORF Transcript_6976/g.16094 Transcript_6976/m.16094 type:complete len:116 (+) Transcript_6976:1950-2297(+)
MGISVVADFFPFVPFVSSAVQVDADVATTASTEERERVDGADADGMAATFRRGAFIFVLKGFGAESASLLVVAQLFSALLPGRVDGDGAIFQPGHTTTHGGPNQIRSLSEDGAGP